MINQFAKIILSTMLTIMPAETNQSYVPMDTCDKSCQETPICYSELECELPKFDRKIFINRKYELALLSTDVGIAEHMAFEQSFLRRESKNEILIRYAVIAQAISEVSNERSRDVCISFCSEGDLECRSQCKYNSTWHWDRLSLVSALLTFAREESGFKGDVHMGVISGAGDCKLIWDPVLRISRYKCKAWCSGQVQINNKAYSQLGYSRSAITGTDLMSTKRCFHAMTLAATKSRGYCESKEKKSWVAGMFSLYGSGYSCNLDIMNRREKTFWWTYGSLLRGEKTTMINDLYSNEEVLSSVNELLTASL